MSSNMSTPFGFGFGARFMLDRVQQFQAEGTPVYIRMTDIDQTASEADFADIGFSIGASGVSGTYTDYQIIPQPFIEIMPSKRWGIPETQQQVDGILFTVSHNWVLSQMAKFGFQNNLSVFRDPRVMGLVWNNELHTVEWVKEDHAGGQIINWSIMTNAAYLKTTG